MAHASIAFKDLGGLAETSFPPVGALDDQRRYRGSEISSEYGFSEYGFEDIIGQSPAIQKGLEQIAIVAPTDSTVLLHRIAICCGLDVSSFCVGQSHSVLDRVRSSGAEFFQGYEPTRAQFTRK